MAKTIPVTGIAHCDPRPTALLGVTRLPVASVSSPHRSSARQLRGAKHPGAVRAISQKGVKHEVPEDVGPRRSRGDGRHGIYWRRNGLSKNLLDNGRWRIVRQWPRPNL